MINTFEDQLLCYLFQKWYVKASPIILLNKLSNADQFDAVRPMDWQWNWQDELNHLSSEMYHIV